MIKRIEIIGIVGVPAKYGGFETFADYMCRYISDDFELTVYCSSKSYENQPLRYEKAKLKYIPLNATGIQSIPYDIFSIISSLKNSDILLVLGSSGAIILPLLKLLTKKKIVFNMAGLEWKRSKWNKYARLFLKISEKIAVKYSDVVVVDNRGLQEYILSEYNVENTVIAYGSDHAKKTNLSKEVVDCFDFLEKPYYAAVARIQKDNNIEMILEAFERMSDKVLVFVGNWDFDEYGKSLKLKYSAVKNIHMIGPIYELHVLDQIRSNCTAYIHGHSSGGTNPSLIEAMHLELPIIAFDVNFNRYTTNNAALYFKNSFELTEILTHLDLEKQRLNAVKMKSIANQQYTWKHIVSEYEKLFSNI